MDEKKKSIDNNNEDQLEVPKKGQKYPLSIAFIIGNEFCERFSYYGAKAILVLFFRDILLYNENESTEYYHIFAMACYFTPVIGAIIADSFLGKFRTILYISILYAIGNILLSYSSYLVSKPVTWVGLVAIALGTGGIKPCVSAFGGDQFGPGQESQLQKFFSLFYISINAGSLLSTFLTPILREDVKCFNSTSCFPLAFGVPAALMIVALILFVLGKFITDYVMVPPKKDSVVVQVVQCVFISLSRKWFKRMPKRDHWLDYADDKFDAQTIGDIKALMRVLFLYLPLPIFWALFDQQGSRWTLQASTMDGNFFGVYRIKPDQIQVVNPILIILFIPIFEYGVYPLCAKFNFLRKPLQRIVTGGIFAAIAFCVCGFFQLSIESELPPELKPNQIHWTVVNGLNASIKIDSPLIPEKDATIESYNLFIRENLKLNDLNNNLKFTITLDENAIIPGCNQKVYTVDVNRKFDTGVIFMITENICSADPNIEIFNFTNILSKTDKGGANAAVVFNLKNVDLVTDPSVPRFLFKTKDFSKAFSVEQVSAFDLGDNGIGVAGYTTYKSDIDVKSGGKYELFLLRNGSTSGGDREVSTDLQFGQGGSYIIIVAGDYTKNTFRVVTHNVVKVNSVSMFWQIIQYSIITGGEIMFSITGLEFSYSQAPASMKAVLTAAWLLTVAFGNLIIVIISSARIFEVQSYEFFFFAGLMVADMIVFAIMAYFYVPYRPLHITQTTPTTTTSVYNDTNEEKSTHLNGKTNKEDPNQVNDNNTNGIANEAFHEEDTKF
ncbi:solute carrier family 15 member 1-like [Oppia nitens]|uniref:solute carrier family 15 member 1-like n=1 Tax=Oppia nitens TaxID=1686743 RepID=UPI0023DB32B8|nr:solute carrier family 15 member 1-like [Oppia nitens]